MRYKVILPSNYLLKCKDKEFWTGAKLRKAAKALKGCLVTCYGGTEDNPKKYETLLIEDIFNI